MYEVEDVGRATVYYEDSLKGSFKQEIESVNALILGTLASYRDSSLQGKHKIAAWRKINKAGEEWLTKICLLSIREPITVLQLQTALAGHKLQVLGIAYRRIPIRDMKNLVAGFDHLILDPLVHRKALLSDQMNNLEIDIRQEKPAVDIFDGRDALFLSFRPSAARCSISVEKKARTVLDEMNQAREKTAGWWCARNM